MSEDCKDDLLFVFIFFSLFIAVHCVIHHSVDSVDFIVFFACLLVLL